jgi:hypothetical protein
MKREDSPYHQGAYFQRLRAEAEARRNSPRGRAGQRGGWTAARTYPASLRPRDSRGRFASREEKGAGSTLPIGTASEQRSRAEGRGAAPPSAPRIKQPTRSNQAVTARTRPVWRSELRTDPLTREILNTMNRLARTDPELDWDDIEQSLNAVRDYVAFNRAIAHDANGQPLRPGQWQL